MRTQALAHRGLVLSGVAHLPVLARQAKRCGHQRGAGLQVVAIAEDRARGDACIVHYVEDAERIEHVAFDHLLRCMARMLAEISQVVEPVVGQQPHR